MGAIETCRSAALAATSNSATAAASFASPTIPPNRHCPKCQGLARAEWLADRQSELLPVPYSHVVFTVPALIAEIALHNKAVVYSVLFTSAAETLRGHRRRSPASRRRDWVGRRPAHLGTEPASSSPCPLPLVPGGGPIHRQDPLDRLPPGLLSAGKGVVASLPPAFPDPPPDGVRGGPPPLLWRSGEFGRASRLRCLAEAVARHSLGRLRQAPVRRTRAGARVSRPLYPSRRHRQQPPGRSYRRPGQLPLEGLSPPRQAKGDETLGADEFIRRFLLHVLPDGFHRIRHYGSISANGGRAAKWPIAAVCWLSPKPAPPAPAADYRERYQQLTGRSLDFVRAAAAA